MTESTRAYIYRVLSAIIPVLTTYGVIDKNRAVVIGTAVAAVFGVGLAARNTSTKAP